MLNPFSTERARIRPLNVEDREFIFALLNSEGWIKYIGDRNVRNLDDASDYLDRILSNPALHYFVFEEKSSGLPIGILTYIQRKELPHPDFGFATLPEYHGRGYTFEAGKKLLEVINHPTVILAIALPSNLASKKLLEKLGFHLEELRDFSGEELAVYRLNGSDASA